MITVFHNHHFLRSHFLWPGWYVEHFLRISHFSDWCLRFCSSCPRHNQPILWKSDGLAYYCWLIALYKMDFVRHLPSRGQLSIPVWQLQRRHFVYWSCFWILKGSCIMARNDFCHISCAAVFNSDVLALNSCQHRWPYHLDRVSWLKSINGHGMCSGDRTYFCTTAKKVWM